MITSTGSLYRARPAYMILAGARQCRRPAWCSGPARNGRRSSPRHVSDSIRSLV